MSLEAFAGFYCIFTNCAAVALLTAGVWRGGGIWGLFCVNEILPGGYAVLFGLPLVTTICLGNGKQAIFNSCDAPP